MNKIKLKSRTIIQTIFTLVTNSNIEGFISGKIYKGKSKSICVPGLNCYSCPGALGACPIGSIQAVIGGNKHIFTYYVFGIIILLGILLGRLICGFLCPFGFVQDLMYKIPFKKKKIPKTIDYYFRFIKYFILIFMVILFPILLVNEFGVGNPYFCKLICPSGILGGGLPLIIKNNNLRSMLGLLFTWKMVILIITIITSIYIYRPFCKYICPLGAFYSFFNKFSFYKMSVDKSKCNNCMACENYCKMNVNIRENINNIECIRCNECKYVCKQDAITSGFKF